MIYITIKMTGVTMIIHNCISQALEDYGSYAGTSASLFGFYYYLIISFLTGLMSIIHDDSLHALPLFCFVVLAMMIIIFKICINPNYRKKESGR